MKIALLGFGSLSLVLAILAVCSLLQPGHFSYAAEVRAIQIREGIGHQAIIHMPDGGCPNAYHGESGIFQREETYFSACIRNDWNWRDTNGEVTFDFLLPHERINMQATVVVPKSGDAGRL